MERLSTRLKTLFPSAPWPAPSRSPRGDGATPDSNGAPGPVGYLVSHNDGLSGAHGVGFDYVLGSGGIYVQSGERPADGEGPRRPLPDPRACPRDREVGSQVWPHPDKDLRSGAGLVPSGPGDRAAIRRALGRDLLPADHPAPGRGRHVPRLRAALRGGRRVPLPRHISRASFRPPTTRTSRASESTASLAAWTPPNRS